jgi:hypothetical protein
MISWILLSYLPLITVLKWLRRRQGVANHMDSYLGLVSSK